MNATEYVKNGFISGTKPTKIAKVVKFLGLGRRLNGKERRLQITERDRVTREQFNAACELVFKD